MDCSKFKIGQVQYKKYNEQKLYLDFIFWSHALEIGDVKNRYEIISLRYMLGLPVVLIIVCLKS
jgi:hypothetical protein